MSLANRLSITRAKSTATFHFRGTILIALAAAVIPAQAAFVNITTCNPTVAAPMGSLIDLPGDYAVAATLSQSSPSTDCILITASGVSLTLNGYTIAGSGGGIGIHVNNPGGTPVNQVGIQGPGQVVGFGIGISFENASYSQVDLVTSDTNTTNGIRGLDVSYLTIGSNVVSLNGGSGVLLTDSVAGVVENNDADGNGFGAGGGVAGIDIESGSANTVNNNISDANGPQGGGTGLGILINGNGSRVSGNSVHGNWNIGIRVFAGAGGNEIFNNTSTGNYNIGLYDDNANCGSDTWSNNITFLASPACVH